MGLSVCRALLPSACLQEVGVGVGWRRQRGQEDPFQISSRSSQCQTSRLRTKYLLHQRAPFCEGKGSEWAWMNRLKTDPVLAQSVAHLVPWALNPTATRAQPMIPENRYNWYTNLTHVSRTAKHKISYILQGLQMKDFCSMKGNPARYFYWCRLPTPPACRHTQKPDYHKCIHSRGIKFKSIDIVPWSRLAGD